VKKVLIYLILVLLSVSLVFGADLLESNEIEKIDKTIIKNNVAYVNNSKAYIGQFPYIITNDDTARITFEKRLNATEYDICLDFPVHNSLIKIEKIEKRQFFGLFNEDLKELERDNKRICMKSFTNKNLIELDLKMSYSGYGVIKYNVTVFPSLYNKDISSAKLAHELIVLDPYLIGDLENAEKYVFFTFNNTLGYFSNKSDIIYNETGDITLNTGSCTNSANAFDGNWSTYGEANSGHCYYYYNYTKYPNSFGAIWQIKYHTAPAEENYTISSACWEGNDTILSLRTDAYNLGTVFSAWECYNGASWVLLKNDTAHDDVYEQAVYFSVANGSVVDTASYRIKGSSGYAGYDFRLKQNSNDVFSSYDGTDTGTVEKNRCRYENGRDHS